MLQSHMKLLILSFVIALYAGLSTCKSNMLYNTNNVVELSHECRRHMEESYGEILAFKSMVLDFEALEKHDSLIIPLFEESVTFVILDRSRVAHDVVSYSGYFKERQHPDLQFSFSTSITVLTTKTGEKNVFASLPSKPGTLLELGMSCDHTHQLLVLTTDDSANPAEPHVVPFSNENATHSLRQKRACADNEVDILFFYSPKFLASMTGPSEAEKRAQAKTIATDQITSINNANKNSLGAGTNLLYRFVGIAPTPYDPDESVVGNGNSGADLDKFHKSVPVAVVREFGKIDLVALFTKKPPSATNCGVAHVGANSLFHHSLTRSGSCLTGLTFPHEIGHNIGMLHNREAYTSSPPPPKSGTNFNFGFQVANNFRTIMSYACSGNTCPRILFYSDPTKQHNGLAMGEEFAHNAKHLGQGGANNHGGFPAVADLLCRKNCFNTNTHSDNDGLADCFDACPNEPLLVAPTACGCKPEVDANNNGLADCVECKAGDNIVYKAIENLQFSTGSTFAKRGVAGQATPTSSEPSFATSSAVDPKTKDIFHTTNFLAVRKTNFITGSIVTVVFTRKGGAQTRGIDFDLKARTFYFGVGTFIQTGKMDEDGVSSPTVEINAGFVVLDVKVNSKNDKVYVLVKDTASTVKIMYTNLALNAQFISVPNAVGDRTDRQQFFIDQAANQLYLIKGDGNTDKLVKLHAETGLGETTVISGIPRVVTGFTIDMKESQAYVRNFAKNLYKCPFGATAVGQCTSLGTTITGFSYISGDFSREVCESPQADVDLEIFTLDSTKAEGSGINVNTPFTFKIVRSQNVATTVTVDWAVNVAGIANNAANAADFGGTFPTGTTTFAGNLLEKVITINVKGDFDIEPNELFKVTLSNPSANAVIKKATVQGTINTDDARFGITTANIIKDEGSTNGDTIYAYTVAREGFKGNSKTVNLKVVAGVAAQNLVPAQATDFKNNQFPADQQLTFGINEATKIVQVLVTADKVVEQDEIFKVELFNPAAGTTLDPTKSTKTGRINNDDMQFFVEGVATNKDEGNNQQNTAFTFKIKRTALSDKAVATIDYIVVHTTTTNADFANAQLPQGTANFALNQVETTVTVNVVGDHDVESTENFKFKIQNPSVGTIDGQKQEVTATIVNDDTLIVIGAAAQGSKNEGNAGETTEFSFPLTRTGKKTFVSSVNFAVTGISAGTNAADFSGTLPSGTVSFPNGASSAILKIQVSGDTAVELDEQFRVTIANPTNAILSTDVAKRRSDATIKNDDSSLSITSNQGPIPEGNSGNTVFTFTVTRTGATNVVSSVNYNVNGNGASASDFTGGAFPSGTVNFASGDTTKTITVNAKGDTDVEQNEGFVVKLSNANNANIATSEANAVINNDDTAISIQYVSGSTEGQAIRFKITRNGNTAALSKVTYTVSGHGANPATAADFANNVFPTNVAVTVPANQAQINIDIQTRADAVVEQAEGFKVVITCVENCVLSTSTATASIAGDDTEVSIVAVSADKAEGNAGNTNFAFKATRTGPGVAFTVKFTVSGNNVNAADFGGALPTGIASFQAGDTEKAISISVSGDATVEPNEQFVVTLSDPTNAVKLANPTTAVGVIRNDDVSGATFAIQANDAVKNEGSGAATTFRFTVDKAGNNLQNSIDFAVSGPTNAADYVGNVVPSGTLNFGAGVAQKFIDIQVKGDFTVEGDEVITVTLSNPGSGTIQTAVATSTIRNDDTEVAINTNTVQQAEGNAGQTTFSFTVTRTGRKSVATSVIYTVGAGVQTAATAADFANNAFPNGQVSFAVNEQGTKTISIAVKGELIKEENENFIVTLSNPINAKLKANEFVGKGTINNDDTLFTIAQKGANGATKNEGNANTAFLFEVTRAGVINVAHTVTYRITGFGNKPADAADISPNGDFDKDLTINFAAAQTKQDITVTVVGDTNVESNEQFVVTLKSSAAPAQISPNGAVGQIINDDSVVSISAISAAKAEGNNGDTDFTFRVNRVGVTTVACTVTYDVQGTGNTAADANDFPANQFGVDKTVLLAANDVQKDIIIKVNGDTIAEQNNGFRVTLKSATTASIAAGAAGFKDGVIQNDDTSVELIKVTANKDEGSAANLEFTSFMFRIDRKGVAKAFSVSYSLTGFGQNAADGNDFIQNQFGITTTVQFAAGDASKPVEIKVKKDLIVENNEDFRVTISAPTNGVTLLASTAQDAQITNDDVKLNLKGISAQQDEGNANTKNFVFRVERSGKLSAMTVKYTVSGIAPNPADQADFAAAQLQEKTLNLPANQANTDFNVVVKGDTTFELDNNFKVVLSNPSILSTFDTKEVSGKITNDDTGIKIDALSADKPEGNSPTITDFTFRITRLGKAEQVVLTYIVSAVSGTTNAADFDNNQFGQNKQATIGAGVTFVDVTIKVKGDGTNEPDEVFKVTISNPNPASTTLVKNSANGIIRSDDRSFSIAALSAVKPEGNANTTPFTFKITRKGPLTGQATVQYKIVGVDTDATDFDGTTFTDTPTLTYTANQSEKTITINVKGDTTIENNEKFTVELFNPINAELTTSSADGLIQADDISLSIVAVTGSVVEGNAGSSEFVYKVTRQGDKTKQVVFSYRVEAGNTNPKASPQDFVGNVFPFADNLVMPANQVEQLIKFNAKGDVDIEPTEKFVVKLLNPSSPTVIAAPILANGQIVTDDTGYGIETTQQSIGNEGTGQNSVFNFKITRSGKIDVQTTVQVKITAVSNTLTAADFQNGLGPFTVTFAPQATTKIVPLTATGDAVVEADEQFRVTLLNPSNGGTVLNNNQVIGKIVNDDTNIKISAVTTNILEGSDGGTANFNFKLRRTGLVNKVSSCKYTVAGSGPQTPAVANDFLNNVLPTDIVATFQNGITVLDLTIKVKADSTHEPNESFKITLSAPNGATILNGDANLVMIILNDDTKLSIAVDAGSTNKLEGTGAGLTEYKFKVTSSVTLPGDVSANWAVTGTTSASDFKDDKVPSGTVVVKGTESTAFISVFVKKDNLRENDETIIVTLSGFSNGATGDAIVATASVKNDDAILKIQTANSVKNEGDNGVTQFTFNIVRDGYNVPPMTVVYTVGAAPADSANTADFEGGVFPSGTAQLAANANSVTIVIKVQGDTVAEKNENFKVVLSNPSINLPLQPNSATGQITNDDTNFQITTNAPSKNEGNANTQTAFQFQIDRLGKKDTQVVVNYQVSGVGQHPANAADFLANELQQKSVTFAVNDAQKIISVNVKGDNDAEQDETFKVQINPAAGVATKPSQIATIVSDDTSFSIQRKGANKFEGNAGSTSTVVFTITRQGATNGVSTVKYAVNALNTNAQDFNSGGAVFIKTTVTFNANEKTKDISVVVNGDATVENNENFEVVLSDSTNAAILVAKATATILNDDTVNPSVSIGPLAKQAPEGNQGSTNMLFQVQRGGNVAGTLTINYAVQAGANNPANGADFGGQFPTGQVTWQANDQVAKTISIPIAGDTNEEQNEEFKVHLTGANVVFTNNDVVGTILNDDGKYSIVASSAAKAEGTAQGTLTDFEFTVSRTTLNIPSSIKYKLTGQAVNAADFKQGVFSGNDVVLNFNQGEMSKKLIIQVIADKDPEVDEQFTVTISQPQHGSINTASAVGTIKNDDAKISIALAPNEQTAKAEGNSGTTDFKFVVTKQGVPGALTTKIDLAVSGTGNNAATVEDFGPPLFLSVTFQPQEATKVVSFKVKGDNVLEPNEQFQVTLSNPPAHAWFGIDKITRTIINDDVAFKLSSISPAAIKEDNAKFDFKIEKLGADIVGKVDYTIAGVGQNSIANDDIQGGLRTVTVQFPVGVTSVPFSVRVVSDQKFELNEQFKVTLSNKSPNFAIIVDPISITKTIIDDDIQIELVAPNQDNSYTIVEGSSQQTTNFVVTVKRTGVLNSAVSARVAIAPSGNQPTNAADFVSAQPQIASFQANEVEKKLTFQVKGDNNLEFDETFDVVLSQLNVAVSLKNDRIQGTILNDDTQYIVTVPNTVDELTGQDSVVTATISRTGKLVQHAIKWELLFLQVQNGAVAADFTGKLLDTIAFAPNEQQKQFSFRVKGDQLLEVTEIFKVKLSSIASANVAYSEFPTVAIVDNDFGVKIEALDAEKPEGDAGSTDFTFTVTRVGNKNTIFAVNYAVTGTGGLNGIDFVGNNVLPEGTINFAANQLTQVLKIKVRGDVSQEGTETFTVTLSNPSNGAGILPNKGSANGKILGDDGANASFNIKVSNAATITEGNQGKKLLVFEVTRFGNLAKVGSVKYTATGTTNAADFVNPQPTATLTFAINQAIRNIVFEVNGDTDVEADETLIITLSAPGADTIVKGVATATILNDDSVYSLSGPVQVTEGSSLQGSTTVSYTVKRVGATTIAGSVDVSFSPGTTDAKDFVIQPPQLSTLFFAANSNQETISVFVKQDFDKEADETFDISISNAKNGKIQQNAAKVTTKILNDDNVLVTFGITATATAQGNEGSNGGPNPYKFTVTTSSVQVASAVRYQIDFAASTANQADFAGPLTGVVQFAINGPKSKDITFIVVRDNQKEKDEKFVVKLVAISPPNAVATATATGTILNDDKCGPNRGGPDCVLCSQEPHGFKDETSDSCKVCVPPLELNQNRNGCVKLADCKGLLEVRVSDGKTASIASGSALQFNGAVTEADFITIDAQLAPNTKSNPAFPISLKARPLGGFGNNYYSTTVAITGVACSPISVTIRVLDVLQDNAAPVNTFKELGTFLSTDAGVQTVTIIIAQSRKRAILLSNAQVLSIINQLVSMLDIPASSIIVEKTDATSVTFGIKNHPTAVNTLIQLLATNNPVLINTPLAGATASIVKPVVAPATNVPGTTNPGTAPVVIIPATNINNNNNPSVQPSPRSRPTRTTIKLPSVNIYQPSPQPSPSPTASSPSSSGSTLVYCQSVILAILVVALVTAL